MNLTEIVYKLNGEISPVGETNEDNKRIENLNNMIDLIEHLVSDINDVSAHSNNHQFSMKRAGDKARNFINELTKQYL